MAIKVDFFKFKEHGTITEIRQDVVRVNGLANCMNGQLVKLGEAGQGVIVGFDPKHVLVLTVND